MIRIGVYFIILSLLSACQNSVLSGIEDETSSKIEFASITKLGPNNVTILWKCSRLTKGYLLGPTGIFPSLTSAKTHIMEISGLSPQTNYEVFASCEKPNFSNGIPIRFRTWVSASPEKTQGIWIVGGIGSDGNPVSQIDLFDANTATWYPTITSVPTPRAFASIVSHKNLIYIIGGLEKSGSVYSTSLKVEAYDPYNDIWITKADLPQSSLGAIAGSIGDEIYVISGSGSATVTTSPTLNTVLKLYPDLGTTGQWLSYTSNSSILSRTDMSGCSIDGVIYYSGGRSVSNGSVQFGTDGFIPTANTVTGSSEPSINVARSGGAGVCVNPEPKDLYPSDNQWFSVIGGSIVTDTSEPISALTSSAKTDFHQPGSTSFSAGPDLPQSLYAPASQISYETRRIYVFGGANNLNTPLDTIYSIDSASPVSGSWNTLSSTMPIPRFGHQAIRIDR
ncbi:Kelch repeat-containing protein [Leptospira dzoumogneensis]|uniref:Kelch repeat-containing protein n=1 Tax=Leptospira dzoumogneensis TaxID=2484904 RepID=A0A4Z1AL51_9LEPT|nr:kelch repeat-containing protein [Leptospira dzoumogneensis]TGM97319.1 kelch repeat-containing protein [Leptospira dzoumogneensis]